MTVSFSRHKAVLISGIFMFLICILFNTFDFLWNGIITTGEVAYIYDFHVASSRPSGGNYDAPVIKFSADSFNIAFQGVTFSDYKGGEKVNVIYTKSNPTKAKVYSFIGFWYLPLIYSSFITFFFIGLVYAIYPIIFTPSALVRGTRNSKI